MFTFLGEARQCRKGVTRRDVLRLGSLGLGLSLADVLCARAATPTASRTKSVILIWLRGGASHIDSYDMKPDAPAEIRGEFKPIQTNLPGIQVCEHLPLHAKMMDKLAVFRGIKSNDLGDHTPHYILTGFPDRGKRPVFGAVVSHLSGGTGGMPPYVSLMYKPPGLYDNEAATYTGPANRPFVPKADGLANLSPANGVSLERIRDRRQLLGTFDDFNRSVDQNMAGIDAFTRQAFDMIGSPAVRDAFDLKKEKPGTIERYGKFCESFLQARRLVEAGVSVVTCKVGDWDTHEHNFRDHKEQLPQLDRGFHALVTDLHDRGLDKDVAVVMWGEFGRSPRVSKERMDGRDHWPDAGSAVIAGGGFKTGQVIGETTADGGRAKGKPYTPANVLASLYTHLGIDPATTIRDHANRPMYVLDDREPVRELT